MSIKDLGEKIKPFYILLLILVIASIFFGLGRLSVVLERKSPIKISYPNSLGTATVEQAIESTSASDNTELSTLRPQSGGVIGSKSGKKYYYPWCGTVKRIKPQNQVKFESVEAAKAAGYKPAGNCKGLK
ncbi:hypothetical protein H0W91_02780 [Patescibacteria group bacterium]|nr:hypothetical protein [Patescibacteria group bacterium]